jgi:hypothetical protein
LNITETVGYKLTKQRVWWREKQEETNKRERREKNIEEEK